VCVRVSTRKRERDALLRELRSFLSLSSEFPAFRCARLCLSRTSFERKKKKEEEEEETKCDIILLSRERRDDHRSREKNRYRVRARAQLWGPFEEKGTWESKLLKCSVSRSIVERHESSADVFPET